MKKFSLPLRDEIKAYSITKAVKFGDHFVEGKKRLAFIACYFRRTDVIDTCHWATDLRKLSYCCLIS